MIKDRSRRISFLAAAVVALVFVFVNPCLGETEPGSAAGAGAVEGPAYLVGPNDLLNIYVWKEAELTQDVTVMPDGRITFPLIGEVVAEGRSLSQLREEITQRLQDFVTAPEVTVIMKASRSKIIYTLGKLNSPGPYALVPNMTVLQALSTAGGFAQWADEKNIIIVRREGEKEIQIPFNYKEYISWKKAEQNILLKPGDTIVVP